MEPDLLRILLVLRMLVKSGHLEWVYVAAVELHHTFRFTADEAHDFIKVFALSDSGNAQVAREPSASN